MRNGLLITNISTLLQTGENAGLKRGNSLAEINCIKNAYLYSEEDKIISYGKMQEMPDELSIIAEEKSTGDPHAYEETTYIDAEGRMVMPAFCDSHTHIVYAGSREQEFVDKINGLSYKEIAARGGGILNSAKLIHNTSEEELYECSMQRVREVMATGTGAIEIKSGYGLNTEDEIKILKVIRRIKETTPLIVKATYLGAHAYPERFRDNHQGYIDEIINETIPAVAKENLADFIDVFCEEGFFSVEETDKIFTAAAKFSLIPKVHANQMGFTGGVQVGIRHNAISVDHLESTGEKEFAALTDSTTIATLLPGATFFLNMNYAPARKIIESNAAVALASNYNPGSCPSGNMQMAMALACIELKMNPSEALNACTINGAHAMNIQQFAGSISKGKKANFIIVKRGITTDFIPYAFTTPFIDKVVLNGKFI